MSNSWGASQGKTPKYDAGVFRCAACLKDCSRDEPFLQHLNGKSHVAKAGKKGFAGLLPNDAGVIPPLTRRVLKALGPQGAAAAKAAVALAANPRGSTGDRVGISKKSEEALMSALQGCDQHESASAPEGPDALPEVIAGGALSTRTCTAAHGSQSRHAKVGVPPVVQCGGPLAAARQALPAFGQRQAFLDAVAIHQVVVVEGETGSGKTTQIPQFILEAAADAQVPCGMVCTQPRRLAASSVAERVAVERGESVGGCVGYAFRMESRASASTRLLFVTVGVLLRRLESDIDLQGTTHVIVDEVHERTVDTDFLLLLLRDLCTRRPDFRVVLMSATFETGLFSEYFGGGCPIIQVSGRLHPVKELYLEDAIKMTGHVVDTAADWAWGSRASKNKAKRAGEQTPVEDTDPGTLLERYASHGEFAQSAIGLLDPDIVNYQLLAQVVCMLYRMAPPAIGADAILVFLAGAGEIQELMTVLHSFPEFATELARSWVLPLHGSLPPDQQRRVFQRAPPGARKVVCCTNVAETSITVDDIGFVVDSGRMKEMCYDPVRRISTLEDCPVTRANARQRRGRAGRIAPGLAVHLFTRHRHDDLLEGYQKPEVRRVPLEQLVLRIVATIGKSAGDQGISTKLVCARLIEPPEPLVVQRSVAELVALDALKSEGGRQRLTPLGEHLAALPVDARIGKLILLGAAFGPDATDKALTVAAALSSRWPFVAPIERRDQANEAQRRFASKVASTPGMESDHLAVLQAYMEWDCSANKYSFCQEHFLGFRTMLGMADLKRQLIMLLSSAGFVRKGLTAQGVLALGTRSNSDGVRAALGCQNDTRTAPAPLIAALLCAALFPRVISAVTSPANKKRKKVGGDATGEEPKEILKLYVREPDSEVPVPVAIHPSSANAKATKFGSPYLVYTELVQTSRLYAREVTPVHPLALLLFGGHLAAEDAGIAGCQQPGMATLTVAGWIRFTVTQRSQTLILAARAKLDQLLKQKIEQPDVDIALPGGLLQAVAQIVSEPPILMESEPVLSRERRPVVQGQDKKIAPPAKESAPAAPKTFWMYRWREVEGGEVFGPFEGTMMQAWQSQNLFASHPADTRRCSAEGTFLDEEWQPADQVDFSHQAGVLSSNWAKNSRKQITYIAPS